MTGWARLRDRVVSADAIYGTLLFAALIAAASGQGSTDGEGDGIPGDASLHGIALHFGDSAIDRTADLDTLLLAGVTLIVFWLAHVYAHTIAGHGAARSVRMALGHALETSSAMLIAAIPSTLVLLLGVVGLLPDAADWSLVLAVIVLGVLGWQSFAERGTGVGGRIVGAVVSALLGLALMILKVIVH
jgi:hypothetical protein